MTASPQPASQSGATGPIVAKTLMAAVMEAIALASAALGGVARLTSGTGLDAAVGVLDEVLAQLREALRRGFGDDRTRCGPGTSSRSCWPRSGASSPTACSVTRPRFRNINDLDFREWIAATRRRSRGGRLDVRARSLRARVRLRRGRPGPPRLRGRSWACSSPTRRSSTTRGRIFWKMTAGMGDVVFAPLHQALGQRGVRIEYFHRVDELRLSDDHRSIDSVSIPCQVCLAPGRDQYDPLVRVDGLPCFPRHPRSISSTAPTESWTTTSSRTGARGRTPRTRVLRRGVDFDDVVFAIPPGMARVVCRELIADSPRLAGDGRAGSGPSRPRPLQLWLRADEPTLGLGRARARP